MGERELPVMTLDEQARAELLPTFRAELSDHCQVLTNTLLSLEAEPELAEQQRLLGEAFRSMHNLKGAARAVALSAVETLAHELEDMLGAAMRGQLELTPPLFDLLYAAIDTLANSPGAAEDWGSLEAGIEALLPRLAGARLEPPHSAQPSALPRLAEAEEPASSEPAALALEPAAALSAGNAGSRTGRTIGTVESETVRLPVARLDALLEQLGELVIPRLAVIEALAELATLRGTVESWQQEWRKVRPLLRHVERAGGLAGSRPLVRFLERNEARLDSIGATLGALDAHMADPTAQFAQLTDRLQHEMKRLRLVPLGSLATGLERAVRDLARSLGKEAKLVLVGADIQIDRRVLEALKDPLLHLLRNAVDHGIEPPDIRQQVGKPSIGRVVVTAAQRGGTVIIEVEDDGAGLDVGAIRRQANERGLGSETELAAMSDHEIVSYLFLSGFSTRDKVSAVSGRGLGLEIVAQRVEQLGGGLAVESTPGQGLRFVLTLPVTLATTLAVLVEVAGALYALPTVAVERALRAHRLGSVGGRPMLEYEGVAVPVASLGELLNGQVSHLPIDEGAPQTLMLVGAGAQRVAFAIERLVGEQEIVVKPLGYPLVRVRHVAGATILGSGRVVLILNVAELVHTAAQAGAVVPAPQPTAPQQRQLRVLVVDDSLTTRTLERFILEAAGYAVDVAVDGAEALGRLEEQAYDALVSDVHMPNLDGVALTARLRADARFRELPIILVTSLESPEDRERGLQAGADAYLVKSSFDQDYLLRTVRELL